jgi:hypothetical protein
MFEAIRAKRRVLHRWIGFVQRAIMANGIPDLPGVKGMFVSVKNAYIETSEDQEGRDDSFTGHRRTAG